MEDTVIVPIMLISPMRRGMKWLHKHLASTLMGLFTKSAKQDPRVIVQGITIEFEQKAECWTFVYREKEFYCFNAELTLPSLPQIDSLLAGLASIENDMKLRIKNGLKQWTGGHAKIDDGESYIIDVTGFAQGLVVAKWSGGNSWGDLGVDFSIENGSIVEEDWGD